MHAPEFWRRRGWPSLALTPAALAFGAAGRLRHALAHPATAPVPVLCVGNLVVGGAGKTPLVIELARLLGERGHRPHILTRGYGGALAGPVRVDPAEQDFRAVGDEALLLAAAAPTWVARDRPAGARAAAAAGAELILMDDGLQNPSLAKNLAFIAVDAGYGFGNGRVMPAGPLREPQRRGLERVQAAVLIGEDREGLGAILARRLPVARARLVPDGDAAPWRGRRAVAFAGIGRPQKFFDSLTDLGVDLVAGIGFPDHHAYRRDELADLIAQAERAEAAVVTTAKDWVRLPADLRPRVETLPVRLAWAGAEDQALIERLVLSLLSPS
ncbi:tetraacyldisaccharide 4'-kinase [Aliidongia dinghuensis]|uniref:Tetraacyldisaccharide 4'-kinase n=1 Tax=Aliidongia dinghuensis TaxID=1867774 RepID=A0A8J3E1X6_9PROT|nr:tetraacyldisaccharide 4'-kinase [Aliidongia dinghuensis]GGF16112.1 tetraacyldisaccharide 4'-kinase [Aliidongia dinghuensis]